MLSPVPAAQTTALGLRTSVLPLWAGRRPRPPMSPQLSLPLCSRSSVASSAEKAPGRELGPVRPTALASILGSTAKKESSDLLCGLVPVSLADPAEPGV